MVSFGTLRKSLKSYGKVEKESEEMRGARNQQTARAGEYFVAAELNRRGAYAVTFAGNMPIIDVLATDLAQTRTVSIQIKTRRSGSWQTSINEGRECTPNEEETKFWIFVDIGKIELSPAYYIVPDWWIRNNIYEAHKEYLSRHSGSRPVSSESTHHSIPEKRIRQWKNQWDLLKLF